MGYKPITNWDDIQVLYVFQVPFLEAPWTGIPSAERHDKVLALHARCSDIPWRCTWGIWEKNRRKLECDFFIPEMSSQKKNCELRITVIECQCMLISFAQKNDSKTWYKAKKLLVSSCFQRKRWCSDSQWVELLWMGQGHIFLAQFFHHLRVVSCYCMLLPTMSVVIIIW